MMAIEVFKKCDTIGIILDNQTGDDIKIADIKEFIEKVADLADDYGFDVQTWTYNNPFGFSTVYESNVLMAIRNLTENLQKID